jgi:adenine-specific DNA-methyltransferase
MNKNNTSNPSIEELGHSPNALDQRKAQLLALLAQNAPELISDNQLNVTKLQELLGEDHVAPEEHYELSWVGKTASRREIQKTSSHTLRPDASNPAQAQHMLIEGENLEVLRVLQKSYYGKVKMIYIDPPYNTGNDSFVYPDNYSETLAEYQRRTGEKNEAGFLNKQSLWKKNSKESGQYHSAWLSMMYPRLYLARNLLREDGVIAVHMDEHEFTNLEKLLSEIYGEENNLGTLIWDKRNPKGDAKGLAYQHEYVIYFAKNKSVFVENCFFMRKKANADRMLAKAAQLIRDNGLNEKSREEFKKWAKNESDLSGGERAYSLIDDCGDVYRTVSMAWPNKQIAPDDYFIPLIHPVTKKPCPLPERGWRNPSSTMSDLLEKNLIIFGLDETTQPTRKYLLKENMEENISSLLYFGGSDDSRLKGLGIPFENPKVVDVAKKIVSPIAIGQQDIVLDFFAGSGTAAHTVIELNLEDGGNRQCISVQMPEALEPKSEAYKAGYRTIADITRARIDKVIAKLKAEYPDKTTDLACAHFTLAPSNFKVWQGDLSSSEALREQLSMFRSAEKGGQSHQADAQTAMLAELLLKHGLGALGVHAIAKPRQIAGATVHRVLMADDKTMWLCFEVYTEALKDEIVKSMPAQVVMLNTCFVGAKADEQLANLQLELAGLDIGLTVI